MALDAALGYRVGHGKEMAGYLRQNLDFDHFVVVVAPLAVAAQDGGRLQRGWAHVSVTRALAPAVGNKRKAVINPMRLVFRH